MTRFRFIACTLLATLLPSQGFSVSSGDAPPPFTLRHMVSGEAVSLAQFEGKVVYLDFWASWCVPCLQSFPFMNSLQNDYGEQDFVVIAVNLDQKSDDAMSFLRDHPASFVVVENQAGDVAERYGVIAMPSSYLIGRDGMIKEVHNGFKNKHETELRDLIVNLL